MLLRTVVRDCLYLNWGLPLDGLPPPPAPLRYEVHSWNGRELVIASALLFRHERLRLEAVPAVKISYPQFNLRLCTIDHEGVPSVLFRCVVVPAWVAPAVRLLSKQRIHVGRLRYPAPSREGGDSWVWKVRCRRELEVAARQAAPALGEGPRLGSWEKTVACLRQRPRGYALGPRGLRRIETTQQSAAVWPVQAEVVDGALLDQCLPLGGGERWPSLHSAWLCPEIPYVFELGAARERPLTRQAPATG